MDVRGRSGAALLLALSLLASPLEAQQGAPTGAIELERSGRYAEAAAAYRESLGTELNSVAAWLGLERVLTRLSKLDSLMPLIDTAMARHPKNAFLRELNLRAWSTLGRSDSVDVAARRWIEMDPDGAQPYRQWAHAVARAGDVDRAIEILRLGRDRIGGVALAADMAQMLVRLARWGGAAQEWSAAVAESESYTTAAVANLRPAPEWAQQEVMDVVAGPGTSESTQRLGAELLVVWGRPEEGWALLDQSLPRDVGGATSVLTRFVARTSRQTTPQAARARGYALERLADLSRGDESERARLEAAQAFADAGDLNAARRNLDRIAIASGSPGDAASAMATLIRVTIESGGLDEAEKRFLQWQDRLRLEDAARLRNRLARAWLANGKLERAEQVLAGDSTIAGQAVLGWVALYRGDLRQATEHFRVAGPMAASRREATQRTAMIALVQSVEPDSVPSLGEALLWLARADTAKAIAGLVETAGLLPATGGRANVLAHAGELAVAMGEYDRAEPYLLDALATDSAGSAAPAAEFALAFVYTRTGRDQMALQRLEHLILSYPESAIVPQARRLLDQVMGVIPKS